MDDERKAEEKGMNRNLGEKEYWAYQVELNTFMLDKGLYQEYQRDIRKTKKNLALAEQQFNAYEAKVSIAADHLNNGVTIKNPVKEEEDTDTQTDKPGVQ